jgi:hypothetical protein
MAEQSAISWTDATGRRLGRFKSAASACGCTLEQWIERRSAGRNQCFMCHQWKSREEFSKDKSRIDGRTSRCKECTSDASTASRYGMNTEELREFRAKHNHQCGICGGSNILYIDHDHDTGRLRGILCPNCNTAIGRFRDGKLFDAALAYLERSHG